ncbi:c-type cytochrome [Pelagicoccus sp. SDUM812003]|uniref:c-type cytochrome n=1 Tax=Pelagicoccus sp. SDUM812003 TaxID=3041267 RepID=UPI00280F9DE5|nr:c-type cytochrome [Pelagicoccus sp. SDUM812003]MDQ8202097.1 c-type cytochrome [Pelagicoccus sp. SDUM812003]
MPAYPQTSLLRCCGGKLLKSRLLLLLIPGVLAVAVGTLYAIRRPEVTPAIRGKQLAHEMGCFACHGPDGVNGIPDPISPAGRMPGWEKGTAVMYVDNEQEIREWILYGKPHDEQHPPIEGLRAENIEPMPAYEGLVSERELDDLVAYFVAVAEFFPNMPDEAYEGSVVAREFGCFGCHGPSGMGGMPNPKSFTGIIPAWDGEDFKELVKDDDELREWILKGTSSRLMEHPVGRYFLERQVIQMPGYRKQMTDEELEKLIIYIKWLRGHEAKDKEAENPIA